MSQASRSGTHTGRRDGRRAISSVRRPAGCDCARNAPGPEASRSSLDTSSVVDTTSIKVASAEAEHETSTSVPQAIKQESKLLTVCLAGVPNAGKTALMNGLTGGGFHTANYPGVTVTLSRGKSRAELGAQVALVDLPGVHSTVAPTPEEELSCQVIEGRHHSITPDALIIVVDATQFERT